MGAGAQIFGAELKQLAQRRVGVHKRALLIQDADANRQLLEQRAEPLLELALRLLCFDARGDIAVDADRAGNAAVPGANHADGTFDHQLAAIAGALHHHAAPLAVALQDGVQAFVAQAVFVAQHAQHRVGVLAQGGAARPPVDLLGCPIPRLNHPVCANRYHGVADQIKPVAGGVKVLAEHVVQRAVRRQRAVGARVGSIIHCGLHE